MAQMSMAQHLQVMFLPVVYVRQSYVLYSPHDVRVQSCDFPRDVMLGFGDVRVQSCDFQRDVMLDDDDIRAQHYDFCLGLRWRYDY
jgi:hypothetical protein